MSLSRVICARVICVIEQIETKCSRDLGPGRRCPRVRCPAPVAAQCVLCRLAVRRGVLGLGVGHCGCADGRVPAVHGCGKVVAQQVGRPFWYHRRDAGRIKVLLPSDFRVASAMFVRAAFAHRWRRWYISSGAQLCGT